MNEITYEAIVAKYWIGLSFANSPKQTRFAEKPLTAEIKILFNN